MTKSTLGALLDKLWAADAATLWDGGVKPTTVDDSVVITATDKVTTDEEFEFGSGQSLVIQATAELVDDKVGGNGNLLTTSGTPITVAGTAWFGVVNGVISVTGVMNVATDHSLLSYTATTTIQSGGVMNFTVTRADNGIGDSTGTINILSGGTLNFGDGVNNKNGDKSVINCASGGTLNFNGINGEPVEKTGTISPSSGAIVNIGATAVFYGHAGGVIVPAGCTGTNAFDLANNHNGFLQFCGTASVKLYADQVDKDFGTINAAGRTFAYYETDNDSFGTLGIVRAVVTNVGATGVLHVVNTTYTDELAATAIVVFDGANFAPTSGDMKVDSATISGSTLTIDTPLEWTGDLVIDAASIPASGLRPLSSTATLTIDGKPISLASFAGSSQPFALPV